jgi:hypothetical protein
MRLVRVVVVVVFLTKRGGLRLGVDAEIPRGIQ